MSLRRAIIVAAAAGLVACGGAYQQPLVPVSEIGVDQSALTSDNGLTTNGLTTNGLTTNGLTTNGLTTNGLSSSAFTSWFNSDTQLNSTVMKYMIRCAVPSGYAVIYSTSSGTWIWYGETGLAPAWTNGWPMPISEQQLVSACMAAHVNKYGVSMTVSLRGYDKYGNALYVSSSESYNYDEPEGCFFGNLFNGAGVASAYSSFSKLAQRGYTSLRACAANDGQPGDCAPMASTGRACQDICSSYNGEYTSCTWNGVSYKPLRTRLRSDQIASCGDGICQASERCYDAATNSGCLADCGRCN